MNCEFLWPGMGFAVNEDCSTIRIKLELELSLQQSSDVNAAAGMCFDHAPCTGHDQRAAVRCSEEGVLKKRFDMSRVLLLAKCTQHSVGWESFDALNTEQLHHEQTMLISEGAEL